MATYNNIKKLKIGDNIYNLYDSGGTVTGMTTTAGAHTAGSQTVSGGIITTNIPTKTSHLTNDSGYITSDSDENVKSTAVTAATTNYITGSTTSTTTTGGLSKHASAVMYTTADSSTSGYTQLRLGNTTATSSAGGKEGQIRLYGTNATYYLDLKPGAIASSNKTITFPDKSGTVALTSDITGGNYTATSPIDITSDVISHETSGVTAGTYDGGVVKNTGFYIPSFTVDSMGHITSATDLGALIPDITYYDTPTSGVISPYTWAEGLRNYSSYGTTISAGNTTSSITISSDPYSGYSLRTYFRVADVQAYDVSTYEPVIVDWKTDKIYSGGSSITLTVSIASAYTNNIIYFPILTYSLAGM